MRCEHSEEERTMENQEVRQHAQIGRVGRRVASRGGIKHVST